MVWFVLQVSGREKPERRMHSVRKRHFKCIKMSHSQGIKLKMNFKLRTTDK